MSPIAYANPSTFVAGEVLTAAQQNVLAANDRFFHGPPTVRVRRAAAQSMPDGAWDTVQFDTEDWDSNSMWSSTNNDQVFVRTAGKYLAVASAGLANSSGGTRRDIAIFKNSTAASGEAVRMNILGDLPLADANLAVSGLFSMTTSDYLTLMIFQNSGAGLNTQTGTDARPVLSVLWVSS